MASQDDSAVLAAPTPLSAGAAPAAPSRPGSVAPATGTTATLPSTTTVTTAVSAALSAIFHKPRYRVSREIGRGGMGAILEVVDRDMRRAAAMKVMLGEGAVRRQRFVAEAQITGQLEHPNIVPVHELGFDARQRPFFTMKLVDGESLAGILDRLRRGDAEAEDGFPMTRLVRILIVIANAVAFAHHRGVIHRDLKPANIMLGRFGEVLVMDWGLAKVVGSDGRAAARHTAAPDDPDPVSSLRSSLDTMAGRVAGTPAYMPPEQASGQLQRITRRSDVYALGAILYEMLTLTPPVRGGSARASIAKAIAGRIDHPERRAPHRDIPNELAAVAMKALQHDPQRRYASAEDFRRDLEHFLDDRAVSAKADSAWDTIRKLMRRNRTAGVAVIVGALLAAIVTGVAFAVNVAARHRAERQQALELAARAQAEQALELASADHRGRSEAQRRASLALLFQARSEIAGGSGDAALKALDEALEFDPLLAEGLLLRSQLAMSRRSCIAAARDLERYLGMRPHDQEARRLAELCARAGAEPPTPELDAAIAGVLVRQGVGHLAIPFTGAPEQRLPIYRALLEAAWPGAGADLFLLNGDELGFDGRKHAQAISDLSPLRGIPCRRLVLNGCSGIADLTPLKGMPLESLDLDQCAKIPAIAPLAGMRLTHLNLHNCNRIDDFSVLRDMPLEDLDLGECRSFTEVAMLARLPLRSLNLRGCTQVKDLAPLAAVATLKALNLGNTPITDIAPLARLKGLTSLVLLQCPIDDLSPLAELASLRDVHLPAGGQRRGLDRLRGMASLKTIDGMPTEAYWRKADAAAPGHALP